MSWSHGKPLQPCMASDAAELKSLKNGSSPDVNPIDVLCPTALFAMIWRILYHETRTCKGLIALRSNYQFIVPIAKFKFTKSTSTLS